MSFAVRETGCRVFRRLSGVRACTAFRGLSGVEWPIRRFKGSVAAFCARVVFRYSRAKRRLQGVLRAFWWIGKFSTIAGKLSGHSGRGFPQSGETCENFAGRFGEGTLAGIARRLWKWPIRRFKGPVAAFLAWRVFGYPRAKRRLQRFYGPFERVPPWTRKICPGGISARRSSSQQVRKRWPPSISRRT